MQELPTVTVIVPVWNQAGTIGDCLAALLSQEYPHARYDIVVVDNESDDNTAEIVRSFFNVRLLSEPEKSSYAARNRGLNAASGQYVAFTDADCTPGARWLAAGVEAALARPDSGVVGGRIELYQVQNGSEVAAEHERIFAFKQEAWLARGYCVTANWLSPTAVLQAIGGFDARLRSGGDFALCERVRAAGATIEYAPDMVVFHPARTSIAALEAKCRRTTAGYWQRHPKASHRARFMLGTFTFVIKGCWKVAGERHLRLELRLGICLAVIRLGSARLVQAIRMLLGATAPRR